MKRARFHRHSMYMRLALCLLSILLLTACQRDAKNGGSLYPAADASFQIDPASRDTVLSFLRAASTESMHSAFARLNEYGYTRHTLTTQRNREGTIIAERENTVRFEPQTGAQLLRSDSSGTFDFGALGLFTSAEAIAFQATDLADHVIPEDPVYLDPRHRDSFVFRRRPDTTFAGFPVRVIVVQAHPTEGERESIRHARIYLDQQGNLVGIDLRQRIHSFLSAEDSRFMIRLRPAPTGGWLPDTTVITTRLASPFRRAKLLETITRYSAYRTPNP